MSHLIALTGVTGAVGGRVARLLDGRGHPLRFVARDAGRCPPIEAEVFEAAYADTAAMTSALAGVDTLFLVSGREDVDRLDHHLSAVEAATTAGVRKIVYLSFFGAAPDALFTLGRQHFHTEEAIREAGTRFVFLRDNLYTDFVPYFTGDDGVIRGPAGDGKLAMVTRDDVAEAAARVLTTDEFDGIGFGVTGPESIGFAEIAERFGGFIGREIRYHAETEEEAYRSRAKYGAPAWEVEGWVTSYLAVAAGEMDGVTDAIPKLTGHPARSLEDFLTAYPDSYQHLLG